MSLQRFIAREPFEFSNGAIGWRPGGPMDCLGPYAKVQNCPIMIDWVEVGRRTCYATGYADTYWSVPACTRWKGRYVGGFFINNENGVSFHPYDRYKEVLTTTHQPDPTLSAERTSSAPEDHGDR